MGNQLPSGDRRMATFQELRMVRLSHRFWAIAVFAGAAVSAQPSFSQSSVLSSPFGKTSPQVQATSQDALALEIWNSLPAPYKTYITQVLAPKSDAQRLQVVYQLVPQLISLPPSALQPLVAVLDAMVPPPAFQVPATATSTSPIYGAWNIATDKTVSGMSAATSKQYLYVYENRWYLSPATKTNWSWTSGQQVTGTYTYFNGTALGTVQCLGSAEIPTFGVGCSEGAGSTRKVIPWSSWITSTEKGSESPSSGQGTVCQNIPAAFGPNPCYFATIYVREVYDLLTDTMATSLQPTTSKQYLYVYQNQWYRSPATTLTWSWQSGQQLAGSYAGFNGTAALTVTCQGSWEQPTFGVGCSEGPGNTHKVIPWDNWITSTWKGEKYPATGQGTVCQDQPGAFGPLPCYMASIYVIER